MKHAILFLLPILMWVQLGCSRQPSPPASVPTSTADPTPPRSSSTTPTTTEKSPLEVKPPPPVAAKPVSAAPVAKKERRAPTETVALAADVFAAEIRKNPADAARKFEPALIELSGVVRAVGARDQQSYVTLDAGPESLGVLCVLRNENEPWAKISKGQKIKLRGRWPEAYSQPGLEACDLVETGPSLALEVKTEALAEEFVKNRDAAKAKYQDKPLIVTGVIVHATKNDLGAVRLFLQGAGEVRVDCGFDAPDRAEAESLPLGQPVRLAGEFSAFESLQGPALRGCRVITGR
jgi:putative nucleic acid binding protein